MKRVLSLGLILLMTAGLAGCGSSKKPAEATTEAQSEAIQYEEVEIKNPSEYAELGQYKGLVIEPSKIEVSDEEIAEELETFRYNYADAKEVKGRDTVEEGDIVNMDYVCTVKGQTNEDYTNYDCDITIGDGELDMGEGLDLEEAVIGKKKGEKVKVTGTFYDDDSFDELAGAEATFEITINKIQEEVLPELNDALVKENTSYKTLKEYRESIREDLEAQAEEGAEENNQSALWDMVVKNSKQIKDFPQDMVDKEIQNTIAYEREWSSYFGLDMGETDEEIEEYFQSNYETSVEQFAKDSLFSQCVLALIVEKEGLEPTEKEIDKMIQDEMDANDYESVEDVYEYLTREDARDQLIQERVMKLLSDNATYKKK